MKLDLKISQKGFVLVAVPLMFELVFVAALVWLQNQAEAEALRQARSREIIASSEKVVKNFYDATALLVAYGVSPSRSLQVRCEEIIGEIPVAFRTLNGLIGSDPARKAAISAMENSTNKALALLLEVKDALDRGDRSLIMWHVRQLSGDLEQLSDRLMGEYHKFVQFEESTHKQDLSGQWRSAAKKWLFAGVAANILIAAALAVFFSRSITRGIGLLVDNTIRLSAGQKLNPAMDGIDELAHLDRSFHHMAEALAESRRRERAVIDHAQSVICSMDQSGNFSAVSPAALKILGFDPAKLLGSNIRELIPQSEIEPFLAFLAELVEKEGSGECEVKVRCLDGGEKDMLWSVFWSAAERTLFCVAHDITERKRAEELLRLSETRTRAIIENMPAGLLTLLPTGEIESANPKALEMLAITAKELTGRTIAEVIPELFRRDPGATLPQLLQRTAHGAIEVTARRASGEEFPLEISGREIVSIDGPRILANIQDVSERHELDKLKQEFVAMVSHDLRTPLTSLKGNFELLQTGQFGELTGRGIEIVTSSQRSIERLIRLINDLLEIEKLESGKLTLNLQNVYLSDIIQNAADAVRPFARQCGIRIINCQVDGYLEADGDRLEQVLVNLASNAVKFSPPGSEVRIEAGIDEPWAEFRVIDQGRGIPENQQREIFERFKQVSHADSTDKKGFGLGLAICKAVIEQHDGEIGVKSRAGEGSTFWFKVPLAGPGGKTAGQIE